MIREPEVRFTLLRRPTTIIPFRVVNFREQIRNLRSRRQLAAQERKNSIVISIIGQVLCKSLIYGFLLAANGHLLRQKASTCIRRASFSSLQLPIGYFAITRNFNLYKALHKYRVYEHLSTNVTFFGGVFCIAWQETV